MRFIAYLFILLLPLCVSAKGLFIAGIGVPSSGKTTVFKELGKLIPDAKLYLEPDEDQWPEAVREFNLVNRFDFQMGLRTMWIPDIHRCRRDRDAGHIVLKDTYYPKFVADMLGQDDVSFILPKDNPYFHIFKQLAELDRELLPDPDVYILLDPDLKTWQQFMAARNRNFDAANPETQRWYNMGHHIKDTLEVYKNEKGIKVITIKQEWSSPEEIAQKVFSVLVAEGIVSEDLKLDL